MTYIHDYWQYHDQKFFQKIFFGICIPSLEQDIQGFFRG